MTFRCFVSRLIRMFASLTWTMLASLNELRWLISIYSLSYCFSLQVHQQYCSTNIEKYFFPGPDGIGAIGAIKVEQKDLTECYNRIIFTGDQLSNVLSRVEMRCHVLSCVEFQVNHILAIILKCCMSCELKFELLIGNSLGLLLLPGNILLFTDLQKSPSIQCTTLTTWRRIRQLRSTKIIPVRPKLFGSHCKGNSPSFRDHLVSGAIVICLSCQEYISISQDLDYL